MKYQYLAYNNGAVENHVIANQLKELSLGELYLDNPDELVSTNSLLKQLKQMGIGMPQKKNGKKKSNNGKKKFKK